MKLEQYRNYLHAKLHTLEDLFDQTTDKEKYYDAQIDIIKTLILESDILTSDSDE